MESLLFLVLTPLATTLMVVVAVVAWRRRDAPGAWGLVGFSLTSAGWLVCDALSLVAPTPEAAVWLGQWTFVWAPLPGVTWLVFLLGYTGRGSRLACTAVTVLGVWCLGFGVLALTNGAHRLVWASWQVVPGAHFSSVDYVLGPVAWAQTVLMWGVMAVSFGLVLWAYAGASARERALSRWIVTGALVPMAVNMIHHVGFGPIGKDFTPLAMAVSSGAFGLGLIRYRLLDLRPVARAALVDNLREGMLVLDAEGRVADVNLALQEVLGKGRAVPGRRLAETAPALAHAIAAAPGETLRVGPAHRFVDLRVSPLTDPAGASTGTLVLLHDVTGRREERAALHRANADLYDANVELQARNEELDAFAHTVAHDLKNSVQGVFGWAELLRDEGPGLPPHEHWEIADGVARSARKMGTVVHELLLLAGVRKAAVAPRPIAMAQVVLDALDRLRPSGGVPGLAPLPGQWPVALGHAPWVEEIWVNFLTNAAKYGGSTITVGADPLAAGLIRFWVHDDGPGLPAEAQRQLFVPFSRVGEPDVEGHGLGLSIVRRIAERLGGTCGVESALGLGTRFWFALPGAPDAPFGAAPPAEAASVLA